MEGQEFSISNSDMPEEMITDMDDESKQEVEYSMISDRAPSEALALALLHHNTRASTARLLHLLVSPIPWGDSINTPVRLSGARVDSWPHVVRHLREQATWEEAEELRADYALSPLHIAAAQGRPDACRLLCYFGADATRRDCRGLQPLALAAAAGDSATVQFLAREVQHPPETLSAALQLAAALGKHEVLKYLLREQQANFEATDAAGMFPLALASGRNHPQCVSVLCKHISTIQGLNQRHEVTGRTALHFAVSVGALACIRVLLQYGADPVSPDVDGNTSLHLCRNVRTVHTLLSECRLDGVSTAPSLHSKSCCKQQLLECKNGAGLTPLAHAVSNSCPCVVEALLHHGADINTQDKSGRSPLHHAAAQVRCICTGVSAVADTEERECCQKLACMRLLLSAGADINSVDSEGATPLHSALKHYRLDSARFLLRHGARPDLRDRFGQTPLAVADEIHILECVLAYVQARVDVCKVRKDIDHIVSRLVTSGGAAFINTLQLMREAGWLGDREVQDLLKTGSPTSEWTRLRHVVPDTLDLWSLCRATANTRADPLVTPVPKIRWFMRFEDYAYLISNGHFTRWGLLEGKVKPRHINHDRIRGCFSRPRPTLAR